LRTQKKRKKKKEKKKKKKKSSNLLLVVPFSLVPLAMNKASSVDGLVAVS
jgi:hypothetical protein